MNNLLTYSGLTDSRMRASDTDLPVTLNNQIDQVYDCQFTIFKNQAYPSKNDTFFQGFLCPILIRNASLSKIGRPSLFRILVEEASV